MNTDISDPTARIVVDGTTYTHASGILTIPLDAGNHTLTRNIAANLFYMKVSYMTVGISKLETPNITLYPNPVKNRLFISSFSDIEKIEIYNLVGILLKRIESDFESIDMTYLNNGSYLIKVYTERGTSSKIVIKNY